MSQLKFNIGVEGQKQVPDHISNNTNQSVQHQPEKGENQDLSEAMQLTQQSQTYSTKSNHGQRMTITHPNHRNISQNSKPISEAGEYGQTISQQSAQKPEPVSYQLSKKSHTLVSNTHKKENVENNFQDQHQPGIDMQRRHTSAILYDDYSKAIKITADQTANKGSHNFLDLSENSDESNNYKVVKTSCSSKGGDVLMRQPTFLESTDTVDELQFNYSSTQHLDTLKTPFFQLDYFQMVQELVQKEGHEVTPQFKENLLSIVQELQQERNQLQDTNFNAQDKYDNIQNQLNETEFVMMQLKSDLENQKHSQNLQIIQTFNKESVNGIIEKLKILKQVNSFNGPIEGHSTEATGKSSPQTQNQQQDLITQILHNWMESTEKLDQAMKKIEAKVQEDFQQMKASMILLGKKNDDQRSQMEEMNSKYEITQIAYLEMKQKFILQQHQLSDHNEPSSEISHTNSNKDLNKISHQKHKDILVNVQNDQRRLMAINKDLQNKLQVTKSLNQETQLDNRGLQEKVQHLQTKLHKALQYLDHFKKKEKNTDRAAAQHHGGDALSSYATATSNQNDSSTAQQKMCSGEKHKSKLVDKSGGAPQSSCSGGFSYKSLMQGDYQKQKFNRTHSGFKQNMY